MTSDLVVTVYTTPRCVQCRPTLRALTAAGIQVVEVDLGEHPDAIDWITDDLGYSHSPVVVVDDHQHWSGFRPDLISQLSERSA
ncbi:glutaredoxin-like protein NrdH [Naumannella cuiyingiana]|uniref:Glutaredoxin-like protein NrdH n=1 Tax=Naumannella cuiyingiana TaxID=1347891 RepID=A0A7Z0IMH2_9ACTN|nr:glutaredoxin domain-containing protein [Naumannella cuiyingiana]NYI72739.1 glutaredoxin-like protein NrdH [Naumannella cuiyingiana]